jgi:hypothetical protein
MLRKTAAILLIILLFFNWFGYRFALNFVLQKSDQQLENRIDANEYDESQLVEIKVALNLPYQNNWTTFERCYGEIEIDGRYYTYVKRKIADNFLILQCLPNHQKLIIKNTGNVLDKALNGMGQEQNNKNHSPVVSVIKNSLNDYENTSIPYVVQLIATMRQSGRSQYNLCPSEVYHPVCLQPPETPACF